MAHAGVDHLRLPCCWTIAQAIVRSAQVRTTFDDLARNSKLWLRSIVTSVGRYNARIDCQPTAALHDFVAKPRDEPIAGPFPYIPGHVIQTITVGRETPDGGRSLISVKQKVFPGKLALPTI